MQNPAEVQIATCFVREKFPDEFTPQMALVCGTGFGGLAAMLQNVTRVPFEGIPAFPQASIASHSGSFLAGYLGDIPLVLQEGRCHLYEGCSALEVCMGVRVMRSLGAEKLLVTNAAGCLNPQWDAGDLMLISDHVNLTGLSPLTGPNHELWGLRFPDMSVIYDREFYGMALEEASRLGLRLERGVYVGLCGPELESPAQTRFLRQIGADAVGMSTVLEVIAARHMGMRVLGLSCLSNKNLPDCMEQTSIEEIIAAVQAASEKVTRLLAALIPRICRA